MHKELTFANIKQVRTGNTGDKGHYFICNEEGHTKPNGTKWKANQVKKENFDFRLLEANQLQDQ